MKKWVKKLRGIAFAALITVALSGKAYAETDEGQLPETPPRFIAPASETASCETITETSSDEVPAADDSAYEGDENQTADTVAAAAPAVFFAMTNPATDGFSDNSADSVSAEASDGSNTGDGLSGSSSESTVVSESADESDGGSTATGASFGSKDVTSAAGFSDSTGSTEGIIDVTDSGSALTAGLSDGLGSDFLTNDTMDAASGAFAPDGSTVTDPVSDLSLDGTNLEDRGDGESVSDPDTQGDTSLWNLGDDTYILIGHDGTDDLQSEGDITVMTAGVNHVRSISGNGKVTVSGTGIFLIDYIDDDLALDLAPLEGMGYDNIIPGQAGSTAVFIWNEETGSYDLSNGGVPGILDEDYILDKDHLQNAMGYRFVIPADEALLLCGTGAEPIYDEEGVLTGVNYYHGTNHGYKPSDWENVVEYTGTLTIGKGVEVVAEYDESTHRSGAIILQNLKSLGGTDSHDGCRHSNLIVTNGGTLTLETFGDVFGELWGLGDERNNRAGNVTIEPGAKLRGEGFIEVSTITFSDPGAVADCNVMLTADHFYLNGTGTYTGLNIKNSTVHLERGQAEASGLEAAFCVIILRGDPNGETLDIARVVDGTDVSLRAYDSRYPVTITGNIQDSGFISLDWGIFILSEGLALNETSINQTSGAIVYNYAGTQEEEVLEASLAMLHIDPDAMVPAHHLGDVIPVSGVHTVEEYGKSNMSSTVKVIDAGTDTTIAAAYNSDSRLIVPLNDDGSGLLDIIAAYQSELEASTAGHGASPYVQVLRMDGNGNISFTEYTVRDGAVFRVVNWETGEKVQINEDGMDGVIAIRVVLRGAISIVEPESPATRTNTTFTGSGILGNLGNNSSDNGDNGNGDNGNGDNGNGGTTGDTSNESTETATVQTGGNTGSSFWVEQITAGEQFVLHASDGEKTLRGKGGHVKVVIPWELSPIGAGKKVYAVFRGADGMLKAFRTTFSRLKLELSFVADCLGEFVLVEIDFEGEEFSPEFYEALEQIVNI